MDDKAAETIKNRQEKEQQLLIEQLKRMPIIQVACEKVNISRATYYRWRKESEEFSKNADEAIAEGNLFLNDIAESQLVSAIKDKNMSAIVFWLKNHHSTYSTKINISENMQTACQLTEKEIQELSNLLYDPKTFKEGQELLMRYTLEGKLNEGRAQLILNIFMAQMRIEDIMTRKTEAEVMSEVLIRNKVNKTKRK